MAVDKAVDEALDNQAVKNSQEIDSQQRAGFEDYPLYGTYFGTDRRAEKGK